MTDKNTIIESYRSTDTSKESKDLILEMLNNERKREDFRLAKLAAIAELGL